MKNRNVALGKVVGVHGVQGWLKVFSYTRPLENIFEYANWQLSDTSGKMFSRKVLAQKGQGKHLRAQLEGVSDRDQAQACVGLEISVDCSELPDLDIDQYYWRELVGLTVKDAKGDVLGVIKDMMETGSNDVMLLEDDHGKALAIPWTPDVVVQVDLARSLLIADWEPLC